MVSLYEKNTTKKQIITNRLDMTYLSNGAGVTIWTIYGKDKTQIIVNVYHHNV